MGMDSRFTRFPLANTSAACDIWLYPVNLNVSMDAPWRSTNTQYTSAYVYVAAPSDENIAYPDEFPVGSTYTLVKPHAESCANRIGLVVV